MNESLCQIPTEVEVHEGFCSMSLDNTPGDDGFMGHFFKACWGFIKTYMVEMVRGFFQGDYLHQDISSWFVILP